MERRSILKSIAALFGAPASALTEIAPTAKLDPVNVGPLFIGLINVDGTEVSAGGYKRMPLTGNQVTYPTATACWGSISKVVVFDGEQASALPLREIGAPLNCYVGHGDTLRFGLLDEEPTPDEG